MRRALPMLIAALSSGALAEEKTIQFRAVEDGTAVVDRTFCNTAPFRYNVRLIARLFSTRTRPTDGKVVNDRTLELGSTIACMQLTHFGFPPGLDQNFYARFDLRDGTYVASGTCKIISNDVPERGIVLAGCALRIVSAPAGVTGGTAVSTSTLNPFRLAGYVGDASWTFKLFDGPSTSGALPEPGGTELVHDQRTEEEIERNTL